MGPLRLTIAVPTIVFEADLTASATVLSSSISQLTLAWNRLESPKAGFEDI